MDPDHFKQAWQAQSSQTRLTIHADLLLQEVRRNQRFFTAVVFWRDAREVGISLALAPLWIYVGVTLSSPWTWYLTAPVLLWIAGYMLADRMRHRRQPPESGEPLRQHVKNSLAEVEHQIQLLRQVFWWYLLPLALSILAFFGQVTWEKRSGGWLTAVTALVAAAVGVSAFAGIYWLNQNAVRTELEPRRRELEAMLKSLSDETGGAG